MKKRCKIMLSTAIVGFMGFNASAHVFLEKIGTFDTTLGEGSAEITAYDGLTERLFVINSDFASFSIVDLSNPAQPRSVSTIDLTAFGSGPTSIASKNGLVAVAIEADVTTDNGVVRFYSTNGFFLNEVTVGALPDMVTFNQAGTQLLVANEGEADGGINPRGSISVIDLTNGVAMPTVDTIDFTQFDPVVAPVRGVGLPSEVIIFPGELPSEDLEPEYIAVSDDDTQAYVTLQENNAVAVIDLSVPQLLRVDALGFKDHSVVGNELDASDRDGVGGEGAINISTWPVLGMYQPDAIASVSANGQNYYLTANEGDARDEDDRIGDLILDPSVFPNAATLQQDDQLGRLEVSTILGDEGNDGDFDTLYAYGARSFTIWNAQTGAQVFDSGSDIEMQTAMQVPATFNSNGGTEDSFDSRSDAKGPEPEGITVGTIGENTYAFVGLERVGGVMIYDVTDPQTPDFTLYQPSTDGDAAPEGLLFIDAADSPNGQSLLLVSHEDTGTVAIYSVQQDVIFIDSFDDSSLPVQ
ncbi:choice-of-anchor I family protein [Marinicella sp. W31]|uniref:choice-of-anchor I family protein n=1 Tax=Marinicella sp. W31 TaxID=3023713 RepID=UPI0037563549